MIRKEYKKNEKNEEEKKLEVIRVKVVNEYYDIDLPVSCLTEEDLRTFDPEFETSRSLKLEDDENFNSNVDELVDLDMSLPIEYLETSNVCFMKVYFDNELVFKLISKNNCFD